MVEQTVDQVARLMNPRTIAIIGASGSEGSKRTGRPLKSLLKHGFTGKVFPVNPKYSSIDNLPCYKSVKDVPEDIDLAAIILARDRVFQALDECVAKRVRTVMIYSSGFAELGHEGRVLQSRLASIAQQGGVRICGPNAASLVNVRQGMALSLSTGLTVDKLVPGNIGFASHSGAFISTALRLANEKGFGYSYMVSLGNEVDLTIADFIHFFVEDPDTRVIAAFVEGLKDGKNFRRIATLAADRRKPILIVKAGRSERGGRVAASHTGSITGDDRAYSAAFRQLGVIRVNDVSELVEISMLFSRYDPPTQTDAAIVCAGSGGAASLMADLAEQKGLKLADFSPTLRETLAKALTQFSIVLNPIDIAGVTADPDEEPALFRACLENLAREGTVGIIVVVIPVVSYAVQIIQHVVDVLRTANKPIVPILLGGSLFPECFRILEENRIPYFSSCDQGVKAVKALQEYGDFLVRRHTSTTEGQRPHVLTDERGRARAEMIALLRNGRDVLTLNTAAGILRRYGFRFPVQGLARSDREARHIAKSSGLPVAMKVESVKILHKSDVSGVRLGIESLSTVENVFGELMHASLQRAESSEVDGILVQQMVRPHTEIILGCKRDPSFGHVLLVGLGGVFVELLNEFSLRLPPVSLMDARQMITELRGEKILMGFRGKGRADIDALAEAIVNFSCLIEELGEFIEEVDINPLFLLEEGKGALIGDALFVLNRNGR
ncbi:acetate--CoA ligase family protein [bacterium]|nr:acetate--CoA ligase family protein [bacterium]